MTFFVYRNKLRLGRDGECYEGYCILILATGECGRTHSLVLTPYIERIHLGIHMLDTVSHSPEGLACLYQAMVCPSASGNHQPRQAQTHKQKNLFLNE